MMGALRRVRAHAGQFALLAVLAMVAALLLTATPRVANRLADDGLRADLAALSWQARDVAVLARAQTDAWAAGPPGPIGPDYLDHLQESMPPVLRRLVTQRWYTEEIDPGALTQAGPDRLRTRASVEFTVRAVTGVPEAVRVVEGRLPQHSPEGVIEVMVSASTATTLGLEVGTRWLLQSAGTASPRPVRVVGVFEPLDPAAGIWQPAPFLLRPQPPVGDGEPFLVEALTGLSGTTALRAADWPARLSWRYRIDTGRMSADQAEPVLAALARFDRALPAGAALNTGLDHALNEFVGALTAVRALLAIVAAGLLATLCGLVMLAARLAVERRNGEFSLLLARGASQAAVARRGAAETLWVIPAAVAAGWVAGTLVPGRAAPGWPVVLAAAAAVLALPAAALLWRAPAADRRDPVVAVVSARRRTAEVAVLVLAALGAYLLRRRGLPVGGAVDPLLVSVPVLLAVGAAVLALRFYPWPVRLVTRLATRTRGSVLFLGLARAGRAATVTGPLVVLVVAIATAALCGVVAAGIADGRDRATDLAVPADALLTADGFALDTVEELAALPGVRAVAPIVIDRQQRLYRGGDGRRTGLDEVLVLVVDTPTLSRVAAESGTRVDLPPDFLAATAGAGPVPALVSPAVAADIPASAFVSVRGARQQFQVAAVVDAFPTISREVDRFVVLPGQALPARAAGPLTPNGLLVAASSVDERALRAIGDRGQRRWLKDGAITGSDPMRASRVTVWADHRAGLDRGGVNGLLAFAFAAGTSGGAALGLLAVAFAVLAGARSRGRVLSRLRTMGLSRRQSRLLLVYELAPLIGVSVCTGAAAGAVLPVLLTPVLRLSTFTGGLPVLVRFESGVVGGIVALGALALAAAIGVEATVNRRMRLGEVLRLGEEG